jgi:hypothetical protein
MQITQTNILPVNDRHQLPLSLFVSPVTAPNAQVKKFDGTAQSW